MFHCITYNIHTVLLGLVFLMTTSWCLASGNTWFIYHHSSWLLYWDWGNPSVSVMKITTMSHQCICVSNYHWLMCFPSQNTSNAENVFMSCRHHGNLEGTYICLCVFVSVSVCECVNYNTIHSLTMTSHWLLKHTVRSNSAPQENGAKCNYNP